MKALINSKTVWVSLIIFVASVLSGLGVVDLDLSPDASWVGIAWSVVQLVLRLLTKQPISVKPQAGILPLMLLMFIPAVLLAGCSSCGREVKDLTLSVLPPEISAEVPYNFVNMPEADVTELKTIFNRLPESAAIEAKAQTSKGYIQARLEPKKKTWHYAQSLNGRTQHYARIKYLMRVNQKKPVLLS